MSKIFINNIYYQKYVKFLIIFFKNCFALTETKQPVSAKHTILPGAWLHYSRVNVTASSRCIFVLIWGTANSEHFSSTANLAQSIILQLQLILLTP